MRLLLQCHFEGVTERTFAADLANKSHVLRIWSGGRLIGFSTLAIRDEEMDGEPARILYSGDTIMDPEGWKSPLLARAWIAMVRELTSGLPPQRCFWLLLSAGFRTYRFLPVFWREFWPRHDMPTPEPARRFIEKLARRHFGTCFDETCGVVRFDHPHRLRGPLAEIPGGRLADPHIAFFLERNPGWQHGDELVCLASLDDANLTPAGRRMLRGTIS